MISYFPLLCDVNYLWVHFDDACANQYNGGPTFAKGDHCLDCLIDVAHTVVCADSYRDRRKLMKEIAEDVLLAKCEDGAYYISKAWYDYSCFYFISALNSLTNLITFPDCGRLL